MAAFYKHICLWSNCGKKCSSLVELIDHIEVIHIDRDPIALEKQELTQPAAIALSYINCFFAETTRPKKIPKQDGGSHGHLSVTHDKRSPALKAARKQQVSDTDALVDDDLCSLSDAESEDSCNSLSTNTSQDNDLTLSRIAHIEDNREGKRRYICPVKGCGKRFKNINGIKYHAKNGHSRKLESKPKMQKPTQRLTTSVIDGGEEPRKGYKCHCGKSYKSNSGLRHHQNTQHGKKSNIGNKESAMIGEHLGKTHQLHTPVKMPHLDVLPKYELHQS